MANNEEQGTQELALSEVARGIWRHRWLALGIAVACAGVAIGYSYWTPWIYEASATIRVSQSALGQQGSIGMQALLAYQDSLSTEIEVLRSRTMAERVVDELGLAGRPAFGGSREIAAGIIKNGLRVEAVPNTSVVRLSFQFTDREATQEVVNGVAQAYVKYALDRQHSEAKSVRVFLEGQLEEVRGRLDKAQQALSDFQREKGIVAFQSANGTDQFSLTSTASEVESLKNKLTELRIERSALAQQYSGKHPKLSTMDVQIATVEGRLGSASVRLTQLQDMQFRFLQLQQAVKVEEISYSDMLARYNQAKVAEAVDVGNVRLLDEATLPPFPIKPKKKLNTALGLLFGLLFGSVAAFIADRLRDVVRSADEAERASGLPLLGFVPRLAILEMPKDAVSTAPGNAPGIASGELVATGEGRSIGSEAFRTLRTNLKYVSPDKPMRVLVVTSGSPGEGKTTIAANIALAAAGGGQRVLLVDADMRRAAGHRLFGMPKEPGLSEVLATGRSWLDSARATPFANLSLMTAGKVPPNPADLVDSARMRDVLTEMKNEYDLIVIDSPPVGMVTDAQILATQADAVLLVVRAGKSHRGVIRAARELLGRVNAKTAGMVMNDVSPRAGYYYGGYGYYRYGYGYGYGYGHGYGYEPKEEGDPKAPKKKSDRA